LILSLSIALGACSKKTDTTAVDQIDSTLMVEDSSEYIAPEQLVARAYSIAKFSELRSQCNLGYVFVTLTRNGVYPASASANLDSVTIDWSVSRISKFDSSEIHFSPPHASLSAETVSGEMDLLILKQEIGAVVTTELSGKSLIQYAEVLLVEENQSIIALGYYQE
jgi:hypothetical protein